MAAALARTRTPNNSAILVLGDTLALCTPALRVAEESAMLDCITDGRLAAGFPVGTSMDVNRCCGITPTENPAPRFYEAHDLIMKAWTQPGPFPYNGRFNQLRYVNPWPQPLQKPHPPVWLAGGGSVETYEMAVNFDYTYSFLSFFGYRFAKRVMDTFWETADRLGVDGNPYRAGFAQQVSCATPGSSRSAVLERRRGRTGAVPPRCRRAGWDPLIDALADGHRVIAPEHPGAGSRRASSTSRTCGTSCSTTTSCSTSSGVDGRRWSATPSGAWWPPSWRPPARSGSSRWC